MTIPLHADQLGSFALGLALGVAIGIAAHRFVGRGQGEAARYVPAVAVEESGRSTFYRLDTRTGQVMRIRGNEIEQMLGPAPQ